MKNRLISAIVMFIFCIGAAVTSSYVLTKKCDSLIASLNSCLSACEGGRRNEAAFYADSTDEQWSNSQKLYLFLLNASDIDVLEEQIGELLYFCETDNLEQTGRAAAVCIGELEHMKETLKPSLENIF